MARTGGFHGPGLGSHVGMGFNPWDDGPDVETHSKDAMTFSHPRFPGRNKNASSKAFSTSELVG